MIGFPSQKLRRPVFRPVGEADPEFEKKATEAEKRVVEVARATAKDPYRRAGPESGRGKYKIEIMFVEGRTSAGPNKCGVRVYLSGTQLHGGGDELAYLCWGDGKDTGCGKPIPPELVFAHRPDTICPSCGKVFSNGVTDIIVMNSTTADLAKFVEKCFRNLGSDADIVVKHQLTVKPSVRQARMRGEQSTAWNRNAVIYTLNRIIADTAGGGSLVERLRVYLS